VLESAKVDDNNAALMTIDSLEVLDVFFILKSSPKFIAKPIKN